MNFSFVSKAFHLQNKIIQKIENISFNKTFEITIMYKIWCYKSRDYCQSVLFYLYSLIASSLKKLPN